MEKSNQQRQSYRSPEYLKNFFQERNENEQGTEPEWRDHKRLILKGYQSGNQSPPLKSPR